MSARRAALSAMTRYSGFDRIVGSERWRYRRAGFELAAGGGWLVPVWGVPCRAQVVVENFAYRG
jgi:hypothetical protein